MSIERHFLRLGGKEYDIKFEAPELKRMDKYIRKEGITSKEIVNVVRNAAGSIMDAHANMKLLGIRLERGLIDQAKYIAEMSECVFSMEKIPMDICSILIYFGLSGNEQARKDGLSMDLVDEWMSEEEFMNDNFVHNTHMITNSYIMVHPSLATLCRLLEGQKIEEIEDDIQRRMEGMVDREERAAKKPRNRRTSGKTQKKKKSTSASRKKAT